MLPDWPVAQDPNIVPMILDTPGPCCQVGNFFASRSTRSSAIVTLEVHAAGWQLRLVAQGGLQSVELSPGVIFAV